MRLLKGPSTSVVNSLGRRQTDKGIRGWVSMSKCMGEARLWSSCVGKIQRWEPGDSEGVTHLVTSKYLLLRTHCHLAPPHIHFTIHGSHSESVRKFPDCSTQMWTGLHVQESLVKSSTLLMIQVYCTMMYTVLCRPASELHLTYDNICSWEGTGMHMLQGITEARTTDTKQIFAI